MVQGYYTLEEAARILGMATGELSLMAQRREVRAFADRGTWRFRTQDIEELARRRGQGSNPDLPLGEAPRPQPHDTPTARSSPEPDEGVFNFGLGTDTDQVDLGQNLGAETGRSGPVSPGKAGSKSGPRTPGPKSPTAKPGSDSDVRLVPDGGKVAFEVSSDSDIKLVEDSGSASKSGKKKATGAKEDSGVKLVPMDSGPQSPLRRAAEGPEDSAVLGAPPSKTSSDSDVRLEAPSDRPGQKGGAEDSFLTEEIDLDAELQKAEGARSKKSQAKPTPPTAAFELSEADLDVPRRPTARGDEKVSDSSSDFEISLPPAKNERSAIEGSRDERRHEKEEEIPLGDLPTSGVASESGINLGRPTDSGISLEPEGESSDEIEFELRQRAGAKPEAAPKPVEPAGERADSSSDFELTLEDSGRLAPLEEESAHAPTQGDKDIFETDFEVPALEEESGSGAMALDESDTDLESSDFDLALGEEDMAVDEESGSQVVALDDEEEVDERAATVARTGRRGVAEEEGEAEEELEEAAPSRRAVPVAAAPATWGLFTPIVLLCSFFVLFLVGLMSFELVRGMWGYRQPTRVASPVAHFIGGLFMDQKDLPAD